MARQPAALPLPYDVALAVWRQHADAHWASVMRAATGAPHDRRAFEQVVAELSANGALRPAPGLPDGVAFTLAGSPRGIDPRLAACTLDPFCYLSHLSAMEYHGFTDRLPERLCLSTPAPTDWRIQADARMLHDFGQDLALYQRARLPALQRLSIIKICQRSLHRHSSRHTGAFRTVAEAQFRVSTIGRTFLDMLREPGLCGGLMHVLDMFRQHAKPHLRLILDEIDQHGSAINKVRAGYVLEELCGFHHVRIDAWVSSAKRGGSRKLGAGAEYSPVFSERWSLSIDGVLPVEWTT